MRKLLSLIALCGAMALVAVGYAPRASAMQLPSGHLALKTDRVGAVQDIRYRCWWRNGYRRCGYGYHRHWRHHRWHNRHWRHRHWRHRYYGRRHYYYRSYARPYYRPYYRRSVYCIGVCWW